MKSSLICFFLAGLLKVELTFAAPNIVTVSPTSTTGIATLAHVKRDSSIATITLGPINQYVRSPAQAMRAAPTGSQLFIVPNPSLTGAIDVYMGPDLLKALRKIVDKDCVSGSSPACLSAIASVLPMEQIELEQKKMPEIKINALGVVATVIGLIRHSKRDEVDGGMWELEAINFEGMSARPPSTIVVLTEADDTKPFTITSTSGPPKPTVILGQNGGVIFKLDKTLASNINDLLNKGGIGHCQTSRKRGLDIPCYSAGADLLLINAVKGPMAALIGEVEGIPHPGGMNPAIHAMILALHMFITSAKSIFAGVFTKDLLTKIPVRNIQLQIFWILFSIVTEGHVGSEIVIEEDKINRNCTIPLEKCSSRFCHGMFGFCTTGEHEGCLCDDEECPANDRTPSCINCGGNDGSGVCPGLKKYDDLWKGCNCYTNAKDHTHVVDLKTWEASRQIIVQLPKRLQPGPSQDCSEKKVVMKRDLFEALLVPFCKDFNFTKSKKQTQTLETKESTTNGDWDAFGNLKLDLNWDPKMDLGTCFDTCRGVFSSFFGSDCSSKTKDEMAESGSFQHDCGHATYFISFSDQGLTTAPYNVGKYTLKLRQWDNRNRLDSQSIIYQSKNNGRTTHYSINITIYDDKEKVIGWHPRTDAGIIGADPYEKTSALNLTSELENIMVISPDLREGGMVTFNLTHNLIESNSTNNCNYPENEEWMFSSDGVDKFRNIRCWWECYWRGGNSSNTLVL